MTNNTTAAIEVTSTEQATDSAAPGVIIYRGWDPARPFHVEDNPGTSVELLDIDPDQPLDIIGTEAGYAAGEIDWHADTDATYGLVTPPPIEVEVWWDDNGDDGEGWAYRFDGGSGPLDSDSDADIIAAVEATAGYTLDVAYTDPTDGRTWTRIIEIPVEVAR